MKFKHHKLIVSFIVTFILCCAAILGAWLAGADPSGWSFALAAVFSGVLVGMVKGLGG